MVGGKIAGVVGMVALAVVSGGCAELWTPLPRQQPVDRAQMPLEALPAPGPTMTQRTPGMAIEPPTEEVKGVYQFTVPETVTQAQKQTGTYEQYLLYWGQPEANEKPFIVITVGPGVASESEKPDSPLKAQGSRTYKLNGLIAKEWTGYTTDKRPYCELLVTRLGAGDQLHAVAVVKNQQQRDVALEVLGSIEWKPMK